MSGRRRGRRLANRPQAPTVRKITEAIKDLVKARRKAARKTPNSGLGADEMGFEIKENSPN